MKRQQYNRHTARQAKPQAVKMKDVRAMAIEEFMQVPERLHYCIGRLQVAYALFSIGNMYAEEINEQFLKHDIFLPFIKDKARRLAMALDSYKCEMDKLFKERGDKREFSEFMAEFQSDIEKMLHLDVDEENLRKAELEFRNKQNTNN